MSWRLGLALWLVAAAVHSGEPMKNIVWQSYSASGEVNVRVSAESVLLENDDATLNLLRPRITDAEGNIYTAERGVFSRGHIFLQGGSQASLGNARISADVLELYPDARMLKLQGGVSGSGEGIAFSARSGEYDHASRTLALSGDVRTSVAR